MIRLRALGPPRLTGDGGERVNSVLAQPKRLALLVYLATSEPAGFRRRDELLALFWPESDDHRARAALRKSLHHLRKSLGIDALPGGGDEVGVDPGRIWSDVRDFRAALAEGRAVEALDLYQGEFLEGFHVDECPGFERWLEEERVRLRRKATEAALEAAEAKVEDGTPREVSELARRAEDLSPFDETVHRRALRLLDRVGDDAGALRLHERFAQRLAGELETTPSPRTEALVDEIRHHPPAGDKAATPERRPAPPFAGDRRAQPPARTPSVDAQGHLSTVPADIRVVPTRGDPPYGLVGSWPTRLGVAAMGLVLIVGWFVGVDRFPGPSGEGGSEMREHLVTVLPATVEGSAESDFLSLAITHLLASALDGAGELATVDPMSVVGFLAREPRGPLTPSIGREAAAYFGAGRFVLPRVVEVGGRIKVFAYLYGADEEPEVTAEAPAAEEGQLFELVEDMARQLVASHAGRVGDGLTKVGSATTRSLPALKAFLRGEVLFRQGLAEPARARAAVTEYRRAVEEDTTFAMAYFRMAYLQSTVPEPLNTEGMMDRALRYSDRLPPRDRWLLGCFNAGARGYQEDAETQCRRVLDRDPSNPDAWLLLADALHHLGLRRGRPIAEVEDAYDQALAREPSYLLWLLLHHRSWLALVEEDFAGAVGYLEPALELRPDGAIDRIDRALVDAFRGEEGAKVEVAAAFDAQSNPFLRYVGAHYTWPLEDREFTIGILRDITAPDRMRQTRALGHRVIAHEELAAGRVEAARGELDQAMSLEPISVVSQGYLLLSPYLDVSPEALMKALDHLARWNPNGVSDQIWKLYVMGLLAERLGDVAEAERCAAELEAHADRPILSDGRRPPPVLADDLALYLRARLAFGKGRSEEAWAFLDRTDPERWWSVMAYTAHEKQLYERWLTADVLVALGRHEEALHWLAGIGTEAERAYMGIRHFRMAEIYEELGDTAEAVDHYGRFVRHWKDADPQLRWRVELAEQRLEALRPS